MIMSTRYRQRELFERLKYQVWDKPHIGLDSSNELKEDISSVHGLKESVYLDFESYCDPLEVLEAGEQSVHSDQSISTSTTNRGK